MSTFSLYKKVPMGVGVSRPQIIIYVVEWVASGLTPPDVAKKIDELHPDGEAPMHEYVLLEEQSIH